MTPPDSMRTINRLEPEAASVALQGICTAHRWVNGMLGMRPFKNQDHLAECARLCWAPLGEADWLEAFAGHPQIGDQSVLRDRFKSTAGQEQGQVAGAPDAVLAELAELNQAYVRQFGFIFIIAAKGLSAEKMLSQLRISIGAPRDAELMRGAEQQLQIIQSRLSAWQQ